MKITIKLFLIVAVLSANTFAEGNMNNGGRTCPQNTPTCLVAGQPVETNDTKENTEDQTEEETSILTIVKDYLTSLFG